VIVEQEFIYFTFDVFRFDVFPFYDINTF